MILVVLTGCLRLAGQNLPSILGVVNAEGGSPVIAPNTWVEIGGLNLSRANDIRPWQGSDFVNGQMPTSLDGVSVTVNGKSAYIYYINPNQINILTPPDALPGKVAVQVKTNAGTSQPFMVQAQPLSPSFFVFNGGPYVAAQHSVDYSLIGPTGFFGFATTPAKPGEIVVLYANGFGQTSDAIVPGSQSQSGTLSPLPAITIGGLPAAVQSANLITPGLFQFNVAIPPNAPSGDNTIGATYNGTVVIPDQLITVQAAAPAPTTQTFMSLRTATISGAGGWPRPIPLIRTARSPPSTAPAPSFRASTKRD